MTYRLSKVDRLWWWLFYVCFLPATALAQQAQEPFGKNRVQHQVFRWQYISTSNFDIYYYDKNQELAQLAAQHAEREFTRISELLGFSPYSKIKLYLYASMSDLQQSNVGLEDGNDIIGGKTSFFKAIVEVPFPGTQAGFRQEISMGIARTMLYDMMYGGTFKEVVQNAYLLNLPDWYLGGAAYYAAYGWSLSMDDYMREAVLSRRLRKPNTLKDEEARLAGQSLWNYIAERYGRNNISSILNLTRVMRSEESSLASTLGVSFDRLIKDWREWYLAQAEHTTINYVMPDRKDRVRGHNGKRFDIQRIRYSADGKWVAYSLQDGGRLKVVIRNTETGRERVVHTSGYKVFNQRTQTNVPLIGWQGSAVLHVVYSKEGRPWHRTILVNGGKGTNNSMGDLDVVTDFDVHPDGRMMLISASVRGQNDLYFYYPTSARSVAVTNDIYDDNYPRFVGDGSRMVFASNRTSDTLNPRVKPVFSSAAPYTSLYLIDPARDKKVARRLTPLTSNASFPAAVGDSAVIYLSDESGVANLRQLSLDQPQVIELTNYRQSIIAYDVRPGGGEITFALAQEQGRNMYRQSLAGQHISTIPTRRALALGAPAISTAAPSQNAQLFAEGVDTTNTQPTDNNATEYSPVPYSLRPDTSKGDIDFRNYIFEIEKVRPAAPVVVPRKPNATANGNGGSVLNRQKDKDKNSVANSILSRKKGVQLAGDQVEFVGPFPYRNRLGVNSVTTSFQIDPLLGTGAKIETSLTDMFENHKIKASILGIVDLRSSNMNLEYEYLRHRVDFGLRYNKRSLYYAGGDENDRYQRLNLERYEATASYPLNVFSRVSFTPLYARTRSVLLFDNSSQIAALNQPDVFVNYGGFRTELVFDNTRSHGMNLLEGSRAKLRMETMLGGGRRNFSVLHLDMRHYQNLGRLFTVAVRGTAGSFMGPGRKLFVLGGMDNWMFQSFNITDRNDDPFNPSRPQSAEGRTDWLFNQFVTSMRGFAYNAMYGHHFMLGSAELRFPIVRFFYRGPITSNFFQNLMLTSFVDAGTAWNRGNPLNGWSTLNDRTVISDGSFQIRVREFSSPFLIGYGAGLRTMLLGYYVKLDVAQGIRDGKRNENLRYYLTLGFDF